MSALRTGMGCEHGTLLQGFSLLMYDHMLGIVWQHMLCSLPAADMFSQQSLAAVVPQLTVLRTSEGERWVHSQAVWSCLDVSGCVNQAVWLCLVIPTSSAFSFREGYG